ncbi:uncharacterized protein DDB_G0283697 isoform X2 [Diaphorina citri]|uniref:Uncharacterized protein DDB_G0283697 isoform X2 n=1 Tax=Diaphorina citri TaxID=121845 RepID=A0A1S4EG57_DIACI|nr:uncharacterized protein DDB_G0283697 isoform X2 [Diaphorina citri]
MWKLLLLVCLVAAVFPTHAEDKSSSIYETESEDHAADDSDSGISESGLSNSKPAKAAKPKFDKKAPPKEKAPPKGAPAKEKPTAKSSKFPLQFATRVPKGDSDDETKETVGKKIYKDTGYRREKFASALLKEKRRASTVNPNRQKKVKTTQARIKNRRYTGGNVFENTSDLNFDLGMFPTAKVTFDDLDLKVTGIINGKEETVDKAKAEEVLKNLQEMYKERLKNVPTEERSEEISLSKRPDNPIFRPSNETGHDDSEYDEDYADEDEDEEEEEEEEEEEAKKKKDMKEMTEAEKEERAYRLLKELRNKTNIQVNPRDQEFHKKIILDTLREGGYDAKSKVIESVTHSHYDSETEEEKQAKAKPTKSLLHSVEKAYERALKNSRNRTQVLDESRDYKKMELDLTRKSKEKDPRDKKKDKKKSKEQDDNKGKDDKRRKDDRRGRDGARPPGDSRERFRRREERPDRYDRRRPDSRERYDRDRERGGYDRYRDDRGGYGRDRYDTRTRYGDRDRFDSRYRDRGPPRYYSRERYRPRDRYDARPRYGDRDRGSRREEERPRRRDPARDRKRDDKPRPNSQDKYPRRQSKERQTRKKWYSEEKHDVKRVYAKPTDRPEVSEEDRSERGRIGHGDHLRNGGFARMNNPRKEITEDSFYRDYSQFATKDQQEAFRAFMREKERVDTGLSELVTL